jgi:hypothetical protein
MYETYTEKERAAALYALEKVLNRMAAMKKESKAKLSIDVAMAAVRGEMATVRTVCPKPTGMIDEYNFDIRM